MSYKTKMLSYTEIRYKILYRDIQVDPGLNGLYYAERSQAMIGEPNLEEVIDMINKGYVILEIKTHRYD